MVVPALEAVLITVAELCIEDLRVNLCGTHNRVAFAPPASFLAVLSDLLVSPAETCLPFGVLADPLAVLGFASFEPKVGIVFALGV